VVVKRTFDTVVVGAGIAGTASAYFLRQAGFSVALIDTHHPGWGASGRNPGFLWLQTKAAGLSMDFSLACRRFAEALGGDLPDFGFRASGGLIIYRDAAYEPVARAFVADRVAAGLPVELIDRPALSELCPDIGPEVSGRGLEPARRASGHAASGQASGARPRRSRRNDHGTGPCRSDIRFGFSLPRRAAG
jgi:glycine/D-amino acid oxidase-like deaminating enzyme